MNLENVLKSDFPNLYTSKHIGLDAIPGWNEIITELMQDISGVQKASGVSFSIMQVKEKFGALRVSVLPGKCPPDKKWAVHAVFALVSSAEFASQYACSECGKYGQKRDGDWIQILCDKHYKEQNG